MSSIAVRSLLINSSSITGTTKAVFLTLLTYLHGDKTECYPSIGDISKLSGFTRRTIQLHIRKLEELGFIKVEKQKERKSNLYKFLCVEYCTNALRKECAQKKDSEELKESYGVCSHQSKNQTHMEENSTLESGNLKFGASNSDAPPASPAPVGAAPRASGNNPAPPASPAPVGAAPRASGNNPAPLRFSGAIPTNQQVVEIYTLYTRSGFASWTEAQFLEFLSTCSAIARKFKEKKIRNFYGYLTTCWKNKSAQKLISDKDEDRARAKLRQLREIGLINL